MKFTKNVQQVLLFCFTTALYPGNIRPVTANVWTAAEGATGSFTCLLPESGNTKFFCRNKCEAEDIIIKTENKRAQSGRISITFTKESSLGHVEVTFTRLTLSDTGQYRCGLGNASAPEEYVDLEIRVSNSLLLDANSGFIRTYTVGETILQVCKLSVYGNPKFFCRNDCNKQEDILILTDGNTTVSGKYRLEYAPVPSMGNLMYVVIKEAIKSDTGWYKCGYGPASSPVSQSSFEFFVTDAVNTSNPNWTPSVSSVTTKQPPGYLWPLVACWPFVVLLVVFPLILYRKTRRKNVSVNTSGNADAAMEFQACEGCENSDLALKRGESVYQDLKLDCRDPDHIYSCIET